jgi:hypothetical protein
MRYVAPVQPCGLFELYATAKRRPGGSDIGDFIVNGASLRV